MRAGSVAPIASRDATRDVVRPRFDLVELVTPRRLDLVLMPTEQCNFRCTYCYEDFAIGRMRPGVIRGVKALLDRRAPELDSLHLSWFGGEPLMAPDVVLDISAHAARLASKHRGLTYRASMTTNGYGLSLARLHRLVEVGVSDYQVSLDGTRAAHDATRVRADGRGRGTFDRIWGNLLAIRDSAEPVRVMLRVHVHRGNVPDVADLLSEVRRRFADDPRFSVLLKAVERLGGPNDADLPVLAHDEREPIMRRLRERLTDGAGGDSTLLPNPERMAEENAVCYASRPNSLVVRADGRLAKCTVALSDDRNHVGDLRPDGTMSIDRSSLSPWLRGLASLDPTELACPLANLPTRGGAS